MTLEDRLERLAGRTPLGDPADLLDAARVRAGSRPASRSPRLLGAAAAAAVVAVLAVGVFSLRGSDGRSDVAADGGAPVSAESWDRLSEAPISARTGAVAIATDDELMVWGGRDDSGLLNDGAAYSFDDRTWREIGGPLSPRENAVAVWTGEEVLIYGGTTTARETVALFDGALWDPATGEWTTLPEFASAVNGRTGAAWTGGELVAVGVTGGPDRFVDSDTWALSPASAEWRHLEPSPFGYATFDRYRSDNDRAVVGAFPYSDSVVAVHVENETLVSFHLLDPEADEWTSFPSTWKAGETITADNVAWTGSEVAVVGHDSPGMLFDPADGAATTLPATGSRLRLPSAALDDGVVTVGDKWLDTRNEVTDTDTDTWTDAQDVPADLDSSAVTVAHDGRLYAWNGAGYVWTPPVPSSEGLDEQDAAQGGSGAHEPGGSVDDDTCASDDGSRPSATCGGVYGPVMFGPEQHGETEQALLAGRILLEDDCLYLLQEADAARYAPLPVVWPYGATWQDSPEGVLLADGTLVPVGASISASGGIHDIDRLVELGHAESVAGRARQCGPDVPAVAYVQGEVAVGDADPAVEGDTAVWDIDAADPPTPSATSVTAMVTRLGCSGGETGEVLKPVVSADAEQVVLTFSVEPLPNDAYPCPGNAAVPYVVELDEPLGDRDLVDGACLSGEAASTSFCSEGAVRWSPPA